MILRTSPPTETASESLSPPHATSTGRAWDGTPSPSVFLNASSPSRSSVSAPPTPTATQPTRLLTHLVIYLLP